MSRRLRWAGHVVRMEEGRSAFKILTGKRSLGRPRRRGEEILKWILRKRVSIRGIGLTWLRIGITGKPLRMLH